MRAALLLALCAACDASGVSADQACKDWVHALCTQTANCNASGVIIVYGDGPSCESRLLLTCPDTFKDPGTHLTPSKLDACAKKLTTLSCGALANRQLPDECLAKGGTLVDGSVCGDSFQCANDLCKRDTVSVCGACTSPGSAGAACTVEDDCAFGLVCTGNACVARAALGASCDDMHPCGYGLVCVSGACVMGAQLGTTCTPSLTGQGNCNPTQGTFCNPVSNICQAYQYATAGQTCGVSGNNYYLCGAGAKCTASGLGTGTCMAAAADGAACDSTNGPNCESPALCINSVCTLPDTSTCK